MRYLDTGSRDPSQALGAWLEEIASDRSVVAVRWQSGFFGADAVGYFVDLLERLKSADGTVQVLVGSNEGATRRRDVEVLLDLAGPPRPRCDIGLVAFDNAYFHPKTFHFTRSDGSEAAYVGSANLTGSGTASLHVEAGVVLDTRKGDDRATLVSIRDAVAWWFEMEPAGFTRIVRDTDLDDLAARGLLDAPRPALVRPVVPAGTRPGGPKLYPLRTVPAVPESAAAASPGVGGPSSGAGSPGPITRPPVTTVEWTKTLSQSDAQRKPQGNQRGSITLVAAGRPIRAQTYFRYDFFGDAVWGPDTTRTGEPRERAVVRVTASVLGRDLGEIDMPVSHAPNREASQANYTTLLHLGPLAPYFATEDMTGRELRLERRADGGYALAIT